MNPTYGLRGGLPPGPNGLVRICKHVLVNCPIGAVEEATKLLAGSAPTAAPAFWTSNDSDTFESQVHRTIRHKKTGKNLQELGHSGLLEAIRRHDVSAVESVSLPHAQRRRSDRGLPAAGS